MRIGIDAREIENGVYTGIGRALHDLLRYIDEKTQEEVVVFSTKPLSGSWSARVRSCVIAPARTLWWDQVLLPWGLLRERVDVFYSPYYKVPLLAPCRKVCAVLDLINLKFEGYRQKMTWVDRLLFHAIMPWHINAADKVVTCSSHARADIRNVYGVPERKISVVPLTVSDCFHPEVDARERLEVCARFRIRGSYVIYAGNFKAHKNVGVLIDAFALLAEEHPRLSLVIVGPKEHGYDDLVRRCLKYGLRERVIFTGKVADEQVSRMLYAGARVCVMPSLYEGFGLPPLEAMACGVPVVSSRATSLPEVLGDAAILVDPLSATQMAQAIRRLLRDELAYQALARAGLVQAAKFRPGVVMPEMLRVIREAAGL